MVRSLMLGFGILSLLMNAGAWAADPLAGSEWQPIELSGQVVDSRPGQGAFLRFESDGRVAGFAGCNNFFGQYMVDGDRLGFDRVGATRMMCAGPEMAVEDAMLAALGATGMFLRDGILLHLADQTGAVIARFRQTDFD